MFYKLFFSGVSRKLTILSVILAGSLVACNKYLDKKPLERDVVPSSLADLQAVLDRYDFVNHKGPVLLEALSDNYFITTNTWNSRPVDDRLNYIWDKDAYYNRNWTEPYTGPVYYANVVLDQLPFIAYGKDEQIAYNNIKGSALFYRSFVFYELAQHYCRPFSSTAATDPGIVLRTTSNINEPSVRSTVQQTYDKIINDYLEAASLLSEKGLYPTQPSKAAAYGALARTYLSMRDYNNAGKYATMALAINNELLDFNSLIPVANPPIQRFNKEVIFHNRPAYNVSLLHNAFAKIDTLLYAQYDEFDLRKTVFFKPNADATVSFRGSYEGSSLPWYPFDGITTSELYLVSAEVKARAGDKDGALTLLNTLLQSRWTSGKFTPLTASSTPEALAIILKERRKELVFRGLRWTDLRRFNLEGAGITISRIVNGTTYSLPPNDLRWVLLIPPDVIKMAMISQNPR